MGSRRTLILVAAIAIGAIAAFLVWGYIGGIQDKAYGNAEKVEVYVVRTEIPKGTFGEEAKAQQLIVKDEIPKKFYPQNAIKNLDIDLGGKVAVNNIAVNQIVTTDMFADPITVQTTFADRLEKIRGKDQTAITISVDQVRGVAGLLQPGDYVNIMQTNVCSELATEATEGDPAGGGGDACAQTEGILFGSAARYVYQKAQILAIDQTPVAQPGEAQAAGSGEEGETAVAAQNRGLITLILPVKAAQYIASMEAGSTYLTLVPRDYEPTPTGAIDPTAPLPSEDPSELTPYGPDGPGK